jgi:hypothetical protein
MNTQIERMVAVNLIVCMEYFIMIRHEVRVSQIPGGPVSRGTESLFYLTLTSASSGAQQPASY